MHDLTSRQIQILKSLIEEYIETAEPVGSVTLEKKYKLDVSPATIRNEMSDLEEKGYLRKPHTSAGRIPTSKSLKLYINELMQPEELSVADEVSLKEKVWDSRFDSGALIREAVRTLAQNTNTLALGSIGDEKMYYAGTGYILDMPEFFDIDMTRNLLLMLDEINMWKGLFRKLEQSSGIKIFLGPELEEKALRPYSFVFSRAVFSSGEKAFIGVVGPKRLRYRKIVPQVNYCAKLLEEIAAW